MMTLKQSCHAFRIRILALVAIGLMAVVSLGPSVCRAVMATDVSLEFESCCEPTPDAADGAGAESSSEQSSCPLHEIGKVAFAPGVKSTLKDCPGGEVDVAFSAHQAILPRHFVATQARSLHRIAVLPSLAILQNFRL